MALMPNTDRRAKRRPSSGHGQRAAGAAQADELGSRLAHLRMPAVVGGLVISFVTSWDETVLALFQTGFEKTLPVTIYSFLKSGITTAVSAVAALVTIPVLLGAVILGARAVQKARSTTMRTQS